MPVKFLLFVSTTRNICLPHTPFVTTHLSFILPKTLFKCQLFQEAFSV